MAKITPMPSIHALADEREAKIPMLQPQRPGRNNRHKFAGMKPDRLARIIKATEKGRVEEWADLCETMRRDHHVRSVTDTVNLAVSGATVEILPADDTPLADAAAEFWRNEVETSSGWQSTLEHLLTGEDVGWATSQHVWSRVNGEWHSSPKVVESRDVAFADDWSIIVRTYGAEHLDSGEWLPASDLKRDTLIPHIPSKGMRPTIAGDFQAIAWPWLFRKWLELFRQEGLEKFASPFIAGMVPPNSTETVRAAMKAALENLSSDQVAVMEDGSTIEFLEAAQRPGDAWSEGIQAWNNEITKVKLGSTLNTEVGDTGGNRALGESQFSTTILPRLTAVAARLSSTVLTHWAEPLLRLNAHRFGGVVPPVPKMTLVLVNDEPNTVTAPDIAGGLKVTQNEWRSSVGLDALAPEEGGEEFVQPPPPPGAPAFSDEAPAFEAPTPVITGGEEVTRASVPFARLSRMPRLAQMTLPRAKTTRIASTSRPKFVKPRGSTSGDPAS